MKVSLKKHPANFFQRLRYLFRMFFHFPDRIPDTRVLQPLLQLGGPHSVVDNGLDVVGDKDLSQIVHLQD